MAVKAHNAAQDLKMKDERPDFHLMLASRMNLNWTGSLQSTRSFEAFGELKIFDNLMSGQVVDPIV